MSEHVKKQLRILHLISIKNAITAKANLDTSRGGWTTDHGQRQSEIDCEIDEILETMK